MQAIVTTVNKNVKREDEAKSKKQRQLKKAQSELLESDSEVT